MEQPNATVERTPNVKENKFTAMMKISRKKEKKKIHQNKIKTNLYPKKIRMIPLPME